MRELLRRIELLEAKAPKQGGAVYLIRWQGDPYSAQHSGARIEREDGEDADAFMDRAARKFCPASGTAIVWLGTRAGS